MKANDKTVFSLSCLRGCAATLAIISLIAFAAPSDAAILNISAGGVDYTLDSSVDGTMTDQGAGRYHWAGATALTDVLELEWNVDFDPDPFIVFATSVTNLGAAPQSVNLTFFDDTIVDFPPAGSPMNGTSILTLVNLDTGTGATLSPQSGRSVFTGLIDLMDVATAKLFHDPYTLTVPVNGLSNSDTASLPGGSTSPIDMTTSIGIRHEFEVSAGASGTANSRFEVVPEPTAALLACLGGLGMLLARRRQG